MALRAVSASALALALAAAMATCAHRSGKAGSSSVALPGIPPEDEKGSARPRTRTCPIDRPSVENYQLDALIALGEWNGTSWVIAKASRDSGVQPVLLHLDAKGGLVQTDVPELTEYADFEAPGRLHLVDFGTKTLYWTADLAEPDAPKLSRPTVTPSLLTIADGGFDQGARVKAFAVFGDRALISIYRHHYLGDGKSESFGDTAFYDRTTLVRRGSPIPFTTWEARCGRSRCVGLATANADDNWAALLEMDDSGERHERLGSWGCAGWPSWRSGSKWVVAWLEASKFHALSYDLETGEKRRGSAPGPANTECSPLTAIEIGGRHGVVLQKQKLFVPIDSRAELGKPETMPEPSERTQKYAPLPDSALVLDYTAEHAMVHSPTDSRGFREYHTEWDFSGKSGFLRWNERGLAVANQEKLPLSGTEGRFGDGVEVVPLVRGSFSAVIVAEGYRASFVLLSRPCE